VLDLTRVLAGPVATRFLAGYGADVLRIDPPGWNEPGVIPEVTLGKRCARLDLTQAADRATFETLLAEADVLVHGYRPAALERLGYSEAYRRQRNPSLIDVALDAYGWTGPLAGRRGFDSLVQMSCGIADHGMRRQGAGKPVPLPVQALDHATGYLIAAAVVRALIARLSDGRVQQARLRSRAPPNC
jgi:crotonobetainyl-CoA:carnitine CoA-transferase CaiB-like acyl-CoA transferase